MRSIDEVSGELFASLKSEGAGAAAGSIREVALDLRYEGQEYALTVDLEVDGEGKVAAEPAAIEADFTRAYERAFGHGLPEPIQVVAVRVTSRERLPQHAAPVLETTDSDGHEPIEAYSARQAAVVPFAVVDREALPAGSATDGPAIVLEPTATTYVDAGERALIDPTGHMIIERVG